jgi:hypothetical protein
VCPWNSSDGLKYQKICVEARAIKNIPEAKELGVTIFPSTLPYPDKESFQLEEADIIASEKTASEATHVPATTIEPQIVGCYVYRFREKLYTTDFRYGLFVVAPDEPKTLQRIKPEGTIQISDLKVIPYPLGNNAW